MKNFWHALSGFLLLPLYWRSPDHLATIIISLFFLIFCEIFSGKPFFAKREVYFITTHRNPTIEPFLANCAPDEKERIPFKSCEKYELMSLQAPPRGVYNPFIML